MKQIPSNDKTILKELGRQFAAAAADPVNDARRAAQLRIDNLELSRPTIHIWQEPWSEINLNHEMDLHCQSDFCRPIEWDMRQLLYKWRHHPGDLPLSAVSYQPYCINDSGFGIEEDADVVRTDAASDIASRHYHVQIKDETDIAKIKTPVVSHDEKKTEECFQIRNEIFDGILDVQKRKVTSFRFCPVDMIARLTGIQELLMDLALRPEYVNKLVSHMVDCWIQRVDQYEEQGLLAVPAREMTVTGAAQVFSEVSPEMHREFALQHEARFYKRFGRVEYGCCEPLHAKVDICAECLPNLHKISMSPWINFAEAVRNVRNRFVFAWKPSPNFLAHETWSPDVVRADIREKLDMAAAGGCSVEIRLADLSTVRHAPERLTEWERIAKEEVNRYP